MTSEELERKLKRERADVCLNCEKFLECKSIGRFEECVDFDEVEGEVWVTRRICTNVLRT